MGTAGALQGAAGLRIVADDPRGNRGSAAGRVRPGWRRKDAAEIRQMRQRLENTVGAGDLKRGHGGIVDIEFLVQMFQLQHARKNPSLRVTNTLAALRAIEASGFLPTDEHHFFESSYRFLRTIESRLQLMNSTAATNCHTTRPN